MPTINALIDELEQELRLEEAAFAEPVEIREARAEELWAAGANPSCSTGIHGFITRGYGLLDQYGFWQYPLPDGDYVGV